MLLIPVTVGPSPIHNLGVMAAAPIAKGTVVWQFDPGVDHRHPAAWLANQPPHVKRHVETYGVLSLDRGVYNIPGDQTLFINHSGTPNLKPDESIQVNGEGVVVALRDIAAGEELTIDYGTIDAADRDTLSRGEPLFPEG
jgi:hypothetical protein